MRDGKPGKGVPTGAGDDSFKLGITRAFGGKGRNRDQTPLYNSRNTSLRAGMTSGRRLGPRSRGGGLGIQPR